MMAVPRRSRRAADGEVETPVNGTLPLPMTASEAAENGALAHPPESPPSDVTGPAPLAANGLARTTPIEAHAANGPGPQLVADPGLYAVLGLDPTVADALIQTTYRRLAARLLGSGSNDNAALRQLNVAYEVLGNSVRRAEYDRFRLTQSSSGPPTPIRPGAKAAMRVTRRRRPRHAVQPRYAGLGDVLVVLMVVGLAALAGILIIPRVNINLSALNVLQNVLPLSNSSRRVIDTSVTPVPATPAPSPTPRPGTAERFVGSTVSVSNATPAQNTQESVAIRLRRDSQPAANFDVWAIVKYRTTEERWPATGSVKTDAAGAASISFNVGAATPNYPVQVQVFAQVDDQQLSWSTTFTPH
jgi:DnaJ-like protein